MASDTVQADEDVVADLWCGRPGWLRVCSFTCCPPPFTASALAFGRLHVRLAMVAEGLEQAGCRLAIYTRLQRQLENTRLDAGDEAGHATSAQ
jgi:hypothetical protein